jgi:hypothetical protein
VIVAEVPAPARDPAFYDRPRGYPVSVGFLPANVADVRIRVRQVGAAEDLPGDLFTPADPVHPSFAHNYATAFFVPADPLARETSYDACFEATQEGQPIRWVWRFRTRP